MNKTAYNYLLVIERQIASVRYIRKILDEYSSNYIVFKEAVEDGYFQVYLVFIPQMVEETAIKLVNRFEQRRKEVNHEHGLLSLLRYESVKGESTPFLFHLARNS